MAWNDGVNMIEEELPQPSNGNEDSEEKDDVKEILDHITVG